MSDTDIVISRRKAVTLPLAGLGAAMIGAALMETTPKAPAATVTSDLLPANATKLRALATVLNLALAYNGGPKQVWDNTDLRSDWNAS